MRYSIGTVALISIGLVLTIGSAMAQYTGVPRQRDLYGQTCPPNSFYQGGTCVDATGRTGSTQDSGDWRKLRQRELEDRERTAADRQRDDDWRIQRQRELDDRFGRTPAPSQVDRPRNVFQ